MNRTINDFIILLFGKSGSGKSTIAQELEAYTGWRQVQSYTDRAMRYPDEKGHVFVTEKRFDMIPEKEMVAYTEFDGHRYCATKDQIRDCEVYVIDPRGIREFQEKYTGSKRIYRIMLDVSAKKLAERMEKRGDSDDEIDKRIKNDEIMFKNCKSLANKIFDCNETSPEILAQEIIGYVMRRECIAITESIQEEFGLFDADISLIWRGIDSFDVYAGSMPWTSNISLTEAKSELICLCRGYLLGWSESKYNAKHGHSDVIQVVRMGIGDNMYIRIRNMSDSDVKFILNEFDNVEWDMQPQEYIDIKDEAMMSAVDANHYDLIYTSK